LFGSFIRQHDGAAWAHALDALTPSIHPVDRNATAIWFYFYPLGLAQAVEQSSDIDALKRELRIDGSFRLGDQVDSSHWFLFGHRYWPQVKAAIVSRCDAGTSTGGLDLVPIITEVAADVAEATGVDRTLLTGITAVGLMTLQQCGVASFRSGTASSARGAATHLTPDQILARRAKDDRQGLAGMFRGIRKQFSVTFDERRADGRFPIVNGQQLTTASANDTRDYAQSGPRVCHEGPIPVECRTASCGTCWVGVLSGAEKLSEVDAHEARRLKEFGYVRNAAGRPLIRLACMAAASGNVTIVVPTWNGFLGKKGLGDSLHTQS